jgi:serine/threonine-protein kinase
MLDDPRVEQLLEELLDSGETPEEICRECPELLGQVRASWQRLRAVDAELGAIFPPSTFVGGDSPLPLPTSELPRIHGYDVQGVLGRGGMGVVYKAWHLRLNRPVALKMLLAGPYAAPEEQARFLQEAEAVAGLCHANIVQVHDVGDLDGRPYFTMEYVEGGSLAQKLAGTPQPATQAAALLAAIAEAIQVAHQSGIVHRDLKPANILLADSLKSEIRHPNSEKDVGPVSDLGFRISDFCPKVTDFGLARRLESDGGLTVTGVPVGTPSYMAPEQARGQKDAIGPATDVYALGAILYELLTGRPPFRAETATATLQQVTAEDPVPPSRLNPRVPRDLETICLRCLQKEPGLRYGSAAALADDLGRFLRGEAISARPEGVWRRLARRVRRRPALSAAVATACVLAVILAGAGMWILSERSAAARGVAATEQAVDDDLTEMADLIQNSRWPEARSAWDRANSRLGDRYSVDLRRRLDQGKRDLDMVAELDEIRLRFTRTSGAPASAENLYGEAYRHYGIDLLALEPAESAARIRDSAIRETLTAFLHDWLYWISDATRPRVEAAADLADDDDWRRAYRAAIVAKNSDVEKFKVLAAAPEAAAQPSVILSGLCGSLLAHNYREEALAVLSEAQRHFPGDFWINYLLGHFWERERPQLAVGYFRVALAVRPTSDQAYSRLANALRDSGDADGAIHAYRKAIELNPDADLMRDLAKLLTTRGKLEAVRAAWAKDLDRNPPDYASWYGYSQLCLFLGDEAAYRRNRSAMLDRFEGTAKEWYECERISLACLLRPAAADEMNRVVEMVNRAAAIGPKPPHRDHAYIRFIQGLAEYRKGRPAEAIALLEPAATALSDRAGPRMALAMAQFQAGLRAQARRTLVSAVKAYDWNEMKSDPPTIWVNHVLRREAEALILPNLAAFLDGKYQPQDSDERRALLRVGQVTDRSLAVARAFADAFAAEPQLAEALDDGYRYAAARAAAQAGCGRSEDAAHLSEPERARRRAQAREWLRADLAAWTKVLDGDSTGASPRSPSRQSVRQRLTRWRADPELAGLRDSAELEKLSATERQECRALWQAFDALYTRAGAAQ